jgi:hypothetical protein
MFYARCEPGGPRWIAEVVMHLIMLGALLELAGIVALVVQAVRHSRPATPASPGAADTLEPAYQGEIFPLKKFRLGLILLALGALLLLIGGRV